MVLPELALTGYTCSDLFWQSQMIDAAKEGLKEIADGTKGTDALIFVGLPWEQGGKLFNVAAVLCHGELLGVVPKKYLPNYNDFLIAERHQLNDKAASCAVAVADVRENTRVILETIHKMEDEGEK